MPDALDPDHDDWPQNGPPCDEPAEAFCSPTFPPGLLRKWFLIYLYFVLMLIPMYFTGLFVVGRSLAPNGSEYQSNFGWLAIGIGVSLLVLVAIALALVFKSMILYNAAAQVRHYGGFPAGARVGLLFIPGFNVFWALFAYFGLSRRQLRMHTEHQMDGKAAKPWIVLIWCVVGIIAWLSMLGPVFNPAQKELLIWVSSSLVTVATLLWPLAVRDITEAAETIARWRLEHEELAASTIGNQGRTQADLWRAKRVRHLPRYQPSHFDLFYWLYFGSSVGAFLFAASIVFLIIAFPLAIAGQVFKLMFVYKAWNQIQDGRARTSGGKAVGFIFIPFYNLYWIFVAFVGLTEDINRYMNQREIHGPRCSPGLAITSCIFLLLTIIPYLGLVFIILGGPFWLLTLNGVRRSSMTIAAWKLDQARQAQQQQPSQQQHDFPY